jgi:type IV pilus assembly protein PilM
MLAKLFSKTPPLLTGIDIGSYAVKAITLQQEGNNLKLKAFSCERMPAHTMTDREVQDIESVAKTLKKIKTTHQSKRVATAISGSTVFSKIIQMAAGLSDEELEQQIEVEADSLIPYSLDEVYFDFEKIAPSSTSSNKVDVLLSAARRQSIISRSEAIDSTGMKTAIMDIESYALGRAGQFVLADEQQTDVVCCLDIGATQTLMAIIDNGQVVFASDQAFGLSQLVQALAMHTGTDNNQALDKFENNDLPELFQQQVLMPFQMNLVQQIKRIMQMYMSSAAHEPISTLLLSGSVMQTPGTLEYIQDACSENIIAASPFAKLNKDNSVDAALMAKHEQQMMVALGLALREFDSCLT